MKADAILSRLLALRRLSEQRALETLFACEGEHRRAQRAVGEAADDVARHLAEASAHERRQIAAFAGKPVPQTAIRRFRENLDALMDEQQRLAAVGERARQALQGHLDALEDARASYRLRQRAAAKLDHLARQQSARTALREAAAGEAADEEQSAGRPRPSTSDGN